MQFHYDPFENREPCVVERTDVLDEFMSWTEEVFSYDKKSDVSFK